MHSNAKTHEFFESFLCNSDLDWVPPEITGDLTDAPILGIYEYDPELNSGDGEYYLVERWAFMDYQVKSVLEELLENGRIIFIS